MHPFEDLVIPAGAIGIHWFGQSSFAFKDPEGTILQADPYFPRQRPPERFVHSRPPLSEETLRTDGVLLTHNHRDHTWPESLQRIWAAFPEAHYFGPRESEEEMRKAGMGAAAFTAVEAGDQVSLKTMKVHAVWAKPPGGLPQENIPPPDVTHLGYVVEAGKVRVYLSGDPVSAFAEHESLLAPVRDLHPDLGLLTCQPDEGEFPSFAGSAKMAIALRLKTAVPAHYSCFVKRDYDPREWASHLPPGGPRPLIIPYNQAVVYTP